MMARFQDLFDATDLAAWREVSLNATPGQVDQALLPAASNLRRFAVLISPAAASRLEEMAVISHRLTEHRFGRIVQLYAPLYVSNECIDTCTYCGFSREHVIERITLDPQAAEREAEVLLAQGFRHVLLVSGEHPRIVSTGYLRELVERLRPRFASVAIEVAPQYEDGYRELVRAGVDGLTVYQETYDREAYARFHLAGRKKNFEWRLETPERAARAGMKQIGIGSLLGLSEWRYDALATFLHAQWLQKHCWRSRISVSVPRLQTALQAIEAPMSVKDAELAQLVCALRICLPDLGLVLSTRERPAFRDGLVRLGITQISAGSKTEPGGYEDPNDQAEQFEVADRRSPEEVARRLAELGLQPVWKDWEATLHGVA
jgi:2-iminoacetate synthase